MSVTTKVIGDRFIVQWTIVDEAGAAVTTATVAGLVSTPSGGSAAMSVSNVGNVYKLGYTVTEAGKHGWKATATGAAVGAVDGAFVAPRALVGLPPITVDTTTDIGKIRLLISDVDEVTPILEDTQITAFLAMEGGSLRLGAALALEAIARSEALLSKAITVGDLTTNGPALAAELRASAKLLRDQAPQDTAANTGTALLPVYSFPSAVPWGDSYL